MSLAPGAPPHGAELSSATHSGRRRAWATAIKRREARHPVARGGRRQEPRALRVGVRGVERARRQAVAVRGDRADRAGVRGHEPRERRGPPRAAGEAPDDEPRPDRRREAGAERRQVAPRVADVVGGRVRRALAQAADGGRAERAGPRVEVGLVADLERLEPGAQAPAGGAGEGERVGRVAVLEIEAERHARVEAAGEAGQGAEGARVDVLAHRRGPRAAVPGFHHASSADAPPTRTGSGPP